MSGHQQAPLAHVRRQVELHGPHQPRVVVRLPQVFVPQMACMRQGIRLSSCACHPRANIVSGTMRHQDTGIVQTTQCADTGLLHWELTPAVQSTNDASMQFAARPASA
jgi:uncharacterized Zn-binding protein involved in type VI secretion